MPQPTDVRNVPNRKPPREFLLRDPDEEPRKAQRRRIAAAIVTLMLTIAIGTTTVRYLNAQRLISTSYRMWMIDDLERLVDVQSAFHDEHGRYATDGELGVDYVPSQAVHVSIEAADSSGWYATATHLRTTERCFVTFGTGSAAIRNVPSSRPTCRDP